MKTTVAAVMISAMLGAFAVEGPCKDESCSLPVQGEATYSVMSPVPETAIRPIAVAPRLKSLDGKTVALVGGSFMANVTPLWLAWTGRERIETVPAMAEGKSAFLVTGDRSRNKEMCLPGGGFATVKVRLPREWDRLMAERGYEPLAKFRIR